MGFWGFGVILWGYMVLELEIKNLIKEKAGDMTKIAGDMTKIAGDMTKMVGVGKNAKDNRVHPDDVYNAESENSSKDDLLSNRV